MRSPAWSGTGSRHSARTLGLFVGTIVGGIWLWCLIAASSSIGGLYGLIAWLGLLIMAGAVVALLAPLAVIAFSDGSVREWVALTAGSAVGGVAGLVAVLVGIESIGYSERLRFPLALVSVAAAMLALALASKTLSGDLGPVVLVALLAAACLAFAMPLLAPLLGETGSAMSLELVGLASFFGVGAGLGAWWTCAGVRERAASAT